ncbi:MAG: hypothetical protein JXQ66_04135 [Campylobacterales bacterium]|nr:hypothetical protein [Campylobacterales bacterium]
MKKIILLILIINSLLVAKESEKVSLMGLAALLIKDGYYQRANTTLDEVDTTAKKFDFIHYYNLRGFVAVKIKEYEKAVEYFTKSIKYGNQDLNTYLYIAEANYRMKKYKEAIESYDKAKDAINSNEHHYSVKIDCYWKLKNYNATLETLDAAYKAFPKQYNFLKQKFFYLVQLELFQSAKDEAQRYIAIANPDAKTYLHIAKAFKNAGENKEAIKLLEKAQLSIHDAKLVAFLAYLYIEEGELYSAANLFDKASIYEQSFSGSASEIYRKVQAYTQALYANSKILDVKEKLKQKISIFLEFGEFEKVVALEDMLDRTALLENEDIRYALAYAYFKTEDYKEAEYHLKRLTRNDLFQKSISLRKSMEQCKEDIWECR